MASLRELIANASSSGRSVSAILYDVKEALIASSQHLGHLRTYTIDAELDEQYARLGNRYEILKGSANPTTDQAEQLLRDVQQFNDTVNKRKNEAIKANLG